MFCGNSMNFVRYEMSNKRIQIRKQCFSCGYLDTLNHKFSEFKNINIYDQNTEGEGICRINNIVTFIPYTLKNEKEYNTFNNHCILHGFGICCRI